VQPCGGSRTGALSLRVRFAFYLGGVADQVVAVDNPAVNVIAVKPASRGQGIIVRLYSRRLSASPVTVTLRAFQVGQAYLCDARERDLGPLEVWDGAVRVAMPGTIATIRLLPS